MSCKIISGELCGREEQAWGQVKQGAQLWQQIPQEIQVPAPKATWRMDSEEEWKRPSGQPLVRSWVYEDVLKNEPWLSG